MKIVRLILLTFLLVLGTAHGEEVSLSSLEPKDLVKINLKNVPTNETGTVLLNKHDLWVNYFKKESGGKFSFLPFFGGKTKSLKLLVQKDYVHYRGHDDERVGILIRIEADIETRESEVEIKDFQDLGAAAQLGVANGRLRVKIWGLAGAPVFQIKTDATLTSVSLANIENKLDALHAKIYTDPMLIVDPVILPKAIFEYRDQNRGK